MGSPDRTECRESERDAKKKIRPNTIIISRKHRAIRFCPTLSLPCPIPHPPLPVAFAVSSDPRLWNEIPLPHKRGMMAGFERRGWGRGGGEGLHYHANSKGLDKPIVKTQKRARVLYTKNKGNQPTEGRGRARRRAIE